MGSKPSTMSCFTHSLPSLEEGSKVQEYPAASDTMSSLG